MNLNLILKWRFCYTGMTNLLKSSQWMFEKFHLSTSVHFATRVWRSRAVLIGADLRVLYTNSSIQNAGERFIWCIHISFVNFALHPTPQTKNLTELVLEIKKKLYFGNHSELATCSHELFFLTMTYSPQSLCISKATCSHELSFLTMTYSPESPCISKATCSHELFSSQWPILRNHPV